MKDSHWRRSRVACTPRGSELRPTERCSQHSLSAMYARAPRGMILRGGLTVVLLWAAHCGAPDDARHAPTPTGGSGGVGGSGAGGGPLEAGVGGGGSPGGGGDPVVFDSGVEEAEPGDA